MKRLAFLSFFLLTLLSATQTSAQPFEPDEHGYIKDPKFHKLIKERNYQLVSSFDTLSRTPLIVIALVIHNGEKKFIDHYGKPYEGSLNRYDFKENKPDFSFNDVPDVDVVMEWELTDTTNSKHRPSIPFQDSFSVSMIMGKYGTKKENGIEGLPAIYDKINVFGNGIVGIIKDGLHGLAHTNGQIIIPPSYDKIELIQFGNPVLLQRFKIFKNNKYGLIDVHGQIITEPIFDKIYPLYNADKNGKLLKVNIDSKWGLITNDGKVELETRFDAIDVVSLGLIRIKDGIPAKYGLTDTTGKFILDIEHDEIKKEKNEELITFKKDKLSGKLKLDGSVLLKQEYTKMYVQALQNEFITLVKDNKYGLVSTNGRIFIEPKFNMLYLEYRHGFMYVKNADAKMGCLNLKGDTLFPLIYDNLFLLKNDIFFFYKDKKYGLMNRAGKILKTFDFEDMEVAGLFFVVTKNGLKGMTDMMGNIILPIKYNDLKSPRNFYREGACIAVLNEVEYRVDRYGNELLYSK